MDDWKQFLYYNYIATQFYPWLIKNNIEFPVVVFLDGYSSHMTLPLSQFCKEHKIEIIALYPNSTHLLQPLDVAVIHPLKIQWTKALHTWRIDNADQRLRK